MASRFVSGGTIAGDNTADGAQPPPLPPGPPLAGATNSSSTDSPSAPAAATTATATATTETATAPAHHKILPRADLASSLPKTATADSSSSAALGSATATEWETVQATLEADRQRRIQARRAEIEGDPEDPNNNMSLYAVLQANKAAKQAAFEESTKLRNQFRALDDDEVDFLDEVSQLKKKEEERIKRENEEGLRKFQRAQMGEGGDEGKEGEIVEDEGGQGVKEEMELTWGGAGRKRKRPERERLVGKKKGVVSKEEGKIIPKDDKDDDGAVATKSKQQKMEEKTEKKEEEEEAPKPKPKLGLVDYGSDDDDNDD